MTGLAIGSIKARDKISEVVVVIAFRTWLLDTFVLVFILRPSFHHIYTCEVSKDEGVERAEELKYTCFVSQVVTTLRSFLFLYCQCLFDRQLQIECEVENLNGSFLP